MELTYYGTVWVGMAVKAWNKVFRFWVWLEKGRGTTDIGAQFFLITDYRWTEFETQHLSATRSIYSIHRPIVLLNYYIYPVSILKWDGRFQRKRLLLDVVF